MTLYRRHAYTHGIGWSIWHFEWATKYRRTVFNDPVLQKLCGIAFEEAAKRYRFHLEESEVQPEHMHLLVYLRPSMSPSHAVGLIKGYSSRLLWLTEEHRLRMYYPQPKGKRSLWGDGKFFASVGHITLEKAKEYVEKQKAHHAKRPAKGIPTPSRRRGVASEASNPLGLGRTSIYRRKLRFGTSPPFGISFKLTRVRRLQ